MPIDLPTRYDPNAAEERIYQEWEKRGWFTPDLSSARSVVPR